MSLRCVLLDLLTSPNLLSVHHEAGPYFTAASYESAEKCCEIFKNIRVPAFLQAFGSSGLQSIPDARGLTFCIWTYHATNTPQLGETTYFIRARAAIFDSSGVSIMATNKNGSTSPLAEYVIFRWTQRNQDLSIVPSLNWLQVSGILQHYTISAYLPSGDQMSEDAVDTIICQNLEQTDPLFGLGLLGWPGILYSVGDGRTVHSLVKISV